METMSYETCPVTAALEVIGGRWKPVILFQIRDGAMRFGALRRAVPRVTQKMLTQQLRELERDGIVQRKVHAVVPPHVDYSLTLYGESLKPLLLSLCEWGKKHRLRQSHPTKGKAAKTARTS
jgi:DNA-binding HxlR family transcriptional regulator